MPRPANLTHINVRQHTVVVFIYYDCQQALGLEDTICICSYLLRIKSEVY